jgi:phytoene/squalene synthetase
MNYNSKLIFKSLLCGAQRNNMRAIKKRHSSLFAKLAVNIPDSMKNDFDHAVSLVQKYDPSGYLPGLLVSTNSARIGYFAVRAFYIDSGLRMRTASLENSLSHSNQVGGVGKRGIEIPNDERLEMWRKGLDAVYNGDNEVLNSNPTLRLLHHVVNKHELSQKHFDKILLGREIDVDMKQYPTLESLKEHSVMFCGSLLHLVLECIGVKQEDQVIMEAAEHAAICHGLTNSLRLSIPTVSSTGKVIIPRDLCEKHGIKSPRYLLSALGMGDEECKQNMQRAVEEISLVARNHLALARNLRDDIISTSSLGNDAVSAFLPLLPSEVFLDRLAAHHHDLTNRSLRSVSLVEHARCSVRLMTASVQKQY